MRIFLTGATGFIGSRLVIELIHAGHQVLGLTRSRAGEQALQAIGAQAHRGDIEDLQSLREGAAQCEGVIHTAFDHDFNHFVANCEKDRRAILALGEGLRDSEAPLLITSGTGMGQAGPGQLATEDQFDPAHRHPRIASELAGQALLQQGLNVSVMRLSQIHDATRQGLVTYLVALAREKGVSAYIGQGQNRWCAAHVSDAARLYVSALERRQRGARYHAVAEQGITLRSIAEVIARQLGLPVQSVPEQDAPAHFGWLAGFAASDMPASSAWTQQRLQWHPAGPGLLTSLAQIAP
ncbi:SDR family oxidoreductase [Herbaspirillum sp. YR522]|uniref:SDR family oxidoreductase n=1 Tax=Herbaspirillum sp. YR522 TaxID=1144342 RepID=UPI00026F53B6|nr:SDR family oxidoreductase [Herbaspirillum sp. YR522]EJN04664.1 nucleoside-diphosphate-sugar epimerase [Herbaspirillum sp. YR522]